MGAGSRILSTALTCQEAEGAAPLVFSGHWFLTVPEERNHLDIPNVLGGGNTVQRELEGRLKKVIG